MREAHLDELEALLRNDEVYRHIGGVPGPDRFRLGTRRALAGPPAGRSRERWINHVARDAATGAMLGRLEATVHDGIAEVAFLFGPRQWGRGSATAGLLWLHEQLARMPGPPRPWATTVPDNARSRRLLERCGYVAVDPADAPHLHTYDQGDLVFRGPPLRAPAGMPEQGRGCELDVPAAAACFAEAFRDDPLINHFFADHPAGWGAAATFFRLLMQARLALDMPVIVERDGERVLGGAMGYDTRELEWPEALSAQWTALESASPPVAERFAAYEEVSKPHGPAVAHYYLGVIGVQPELRGTGLGSRLLRAFCRLSDADPASHGTYLETARPSNVRFYARHGFEVAGSGRLGPGVELWCMFRPRSHPA